MRLPCVMVSACGCAALASALLTDGTHTCSPCLHLPFARFAHGLLFLSVPLMLFVPCTFPNHHTVCVFQGDKTIVDHECETDLGNIQSPRRPLLYLHSSCLLAGSEERAGDVIFS